MCLRIVVFTSLALILIYRRHTIVEGHVIDGKDSTSHVRERNIVPGYDQDLWSKLPFNNDVAADLIGRISPPIEPRPSRRKRAWNYKGMLDRRQEAWYLKSKNYTIPQYGFRHYNTK